MSTQKYQFLIASALLTILFALVRIAVEVIQLIKHPLEFFQDWVNWLEMPLYLCSVIFAFVFATPCLCVHDWQWQLGAVSVFQAWMVLITFLQKLPVTGVYIVMFYNIIWTFLKIVFLAVLLIIAFALAFYMLLFDPREMVKCNVRIYVDNNYYSQAANLIYNKDYHACLLHILHFIPDNC